MAKSKKEVVESPVEEVLETVEVVVATEPERLVVAGHDVIRSKEKVVMGKTYTEVLLADGSTQLI